MIIRSLTLNFLAMKKITLAPFLLVLLLLAPLLEVQSQQHFLTGAWRLTEQQGDASAEGQMVIIYSDDYFMFGQYREDGSFIKAGGGSYSLQGQQYEEVLDFHTEDSTLVRQPRTYTYRLDDDKLVVEQNNSSKTFSRIDEGDSPLSGAWRFATRIDEEGNPGERRGEGPRQTIKILSGERFQWAAFNYETKQFSGTGGGTYELKDGRYIETIEFFSRDDSRVGMSLEFDYQVKGDDWYHKGYGSTGKPVNEIWERKR